MFCFYTRGILGFNRCPGEVSRKLSDTALHNIEKDGVLATRLCTHKEDVDHINNNHLNRLTGQFNVYIPW